MNTYICDSQLEVMKVLWDYGDMYASQICKKLTEKNGWNPNTTYTLIRKCIAKGFIKRKENDFFCHANISRNELQDKELKNLVERLYPGQPMELFRLILRNHSFKEEERSELLSLIETI